MIRPVFHLVEKALASGRGEKKPEARLLEGTGIAAHAQDCAPPTEPPRSEAYLTLQTSGHLPPCHRIGELEMVSPMRQRQVVASVLNTIVGNSQWILRILIVLLRYRRLQYSTSVATLAVNKAADALKRVCSIYQYFDKVPASECRLKMTACNVETCFITLKNFMIPRRSG